MADDDRVSPTQLLRELYFNRTGIVFLLMVLVPVLMLVASAKTHGSASQFWLALGTATIATTGYSFVQVLLTDTAVGPIPGRDNTGGYQKRDRQKHSRSYRVA